MSPSQPFERDYSSPIEPKWTVSELLDWIGADDARCHDDRLHGLLSTVERALGADADGAGSTIVLVRSIVARVAAEPALRDLRLDELSATPRNRELGAVDSFHLAPAPLVTA